MNYKNFPNNQIDLLAPNGKPSSLSPELYAYVRTPEFKEWFGDWELPYKTVQVVQTNINHGFKNFKEATKWAIDNIARTYNDEETGHKGNIRISANAIHKYLSSSSVDKSDSYDIHLAVLKKLPEIIKASFDAEQHPDYIKINGIRKPENGINPNIEMHRLYGAAKIEDNTYRVKVTLKAYPHSSDVTKAYNYEAIKIELLEGSLRESDLNVTLPRTTNNSITLAKLLKNVEKSYEKGKKLLDHSRVLDENGEPLVLYRGQMSHANTPFVNHGDGIYFTPQREAAMGYGMDHDPIPVFLNARNPYEVDFDGDSDTEKTDYHDDIHSEYHYAKDEDFDILIATNTFDGENDLDQYVVISNEQVRRIDTLNLKEIIANAVTNDLDDTNNQKQDNNISYQFNNLIREPQTPLTNNDIMLRDKLIVIMQNAGIDVSTDWQEGQAILNQANSQIKSATLNNGEFSLNNNDIQFFLTPQGDAYGFTLDNKIFIDPRVATSETPIHEYAHLWAAAMRQHNPEEWSNIVSLMKQVTPVWEMVQSQYSHLSSDSDIAEEVLAQYSGKQGMKSLERTLKNYDHNITDGLAYNILDRIRAAIGRFWEKTADFLHIRYESAEQVASRIMHDMLNHVNPLIVGQQLSQKSSREMNATIPQSPDIRFQLESGKKTTDGLNPKSVNETGQKDDIIITRNDEKIDEILAKQEVKNMDDPHVGYSHTISDGGDRGKEHLTKNIFYDDKAIGFATATLNTGEGNTFALLADDAYKETFLLLVPVSPYDHAINAWDGVAGKELDGFYDSGCIRFNDEENMIDFYKENRQIIDYRKERFDAIHSLAQVDRLAAENLSTRLPVNEIVDIQAVIKIQKKIQSLEFNEFTDQTPNNNQKKLYSNMDNPKPDILWVFEDKNLEDKQNRQYTIHTGEAPFIYGEFHVIFRDNINAVAYKEMEEMAKEFNGKMRVTSGQEWADFWSRTDAEKFAEKVVSLDSERMKSQSVQNDSMREIYKGCEIASMVDTPILLSQPVDLSYTDAWGKTVDDKYSVAVIENANTIILYNNKDDAMKNFNPYFMDDLERSQQKQVINDLNGIIADVNQKSLQAINPSLLSEKERNFMSQAASDLQTGNHLLSLPRGKGYPYFMQTLDQAFESVKANSVSSKQRELLVELSRQYHDGLNDLADVIGVDRNKLVNNLLSKDILPPKKEMVNFLSENIGENKGIAFACIENLYLVSRKSNIPFEVNLIERNKKGDILLSGMDDNYKWHSVKAESIPERDLKIIYDHLKNNKPISLENHKDSYNKTINHSTIMKPDLEKTQSVKQQEAVQNEQKASSGKKAANNGLGKEAKEILSLSVVSINARKNLDLPFQENSVIVVRTKEQGTKNNVYRSFGEDAERLASVSKSVTLSKPEINGQAYAVAAFKDKDAKTVAKDLADANISVALVNKTGIVIKNDNSFKLDANPQKKEEKKEETATVSQEKAPAKSKLSEEEFLNRFQAYNQNHKTDDMVILNVKNEKGNFYQSFAKDAETAATILDRSVKTNAQNVNYISFKEEDLNKIKDFMKESGKQQPVVVEYVSPVKEKAKDVTIEIKPDSKVEFDIAKNQHAKGVYDIQLLVDDKKVAAHHLSKEDRDAFFKKELPGADLVQKYFAKELNGATPEVSRVQKETTPHVLMETVNGQKVTDARTFTSEKGNNYFVASLDGKQLRPQFIDAETKQKFENKEISVEQIMKAAYPTKLMPKLDDNAFDNRKLSDGREVTFFRIDKENREDRKDFGKYKLEAVVDGARLKSEPLSVRSLNEYFDKVTSKANIVERVFGEQLNMKAAYEKYKLPEGAVMGENTTFRVEKDNAQRRYFISGEVNGSSLDRKQLSFTDASSFWKKAASEEQLGAKYFKNEIKANLNIGNDLSLNKEKSHSISR